MNTKQMRVSNTGAGVSRQIACTVCAVLYVLSMYNVIQEKGADEERCLVP